MRRSPETSMKDVPHPTRRRPRAWLPVPVTVRFGEIGIAGYVERVTGHGLMVQALEPLPAALPPECEVQFETPDRPPAARGAVECRDRTGRRFRVAMKQLGPRG